MKMKKKKGLFFFFFFYIKVGMLQQDLKFVVLIGVFSKKNLIRELDSNLAMVIYGFKAYQDLLELIINLNIVIKWLCFC